MAKHWVEKFTPPISTKITQSLLIELFKFFNGFSTVVVKSIFRHGNEVPYNYKPKSQHRISLVHRVSNKVLN